VDEQGTRWSSRTRGRGLDLGSGSSLITLGAWRRRAPPPQTTRTTLALYGLNTAVGIGLSKAPRLKLGLGERHGREIVPKRAAAGDLGERPIPSLGHIRTPGAQRRTPLKKTGFDRRGMNGNQPIDNALKQVKPLGLLKSPDQIFT